MVVASRPMRSGYRRLGKVMGRGVGLAGGRVSFGQPLVMGTGYRLFRSCRALFAGLGRVVAGGRVSFVRRGWVVARGSAVLARRWAVRRCTQRGGRQE